MPVVIKVEATAFYVSIFFAKVAIQIAVELTVEMTSLAPARIPLPHGPRCHINISSKIP